MKDKIIICIYSQSGKVSYGSDKVEPCLIEKNLFIEKMTSYYIKDRNLFFSYLFSYYPLKLYPETGEWEYIHDENDIENLKQNLFTENLNNTLQQNNHKTLEEQIKEFKNKVSTRAKQILGNVKWRK